MFFRICLTVNIKFIINAHALGTTSQSYYAPDLLYIYIYIYIHTHTRREDFSVSLKSRSTEFILIKTINELYLFFL